MKLFRGISVPRTKIFRTEIPVTGPRENGSCFRWDYMDIFVKIGHPYLLQV